MLFSEHRNSLFKQNYPVGILVIIFINFCTIEALLFEIKILLCRSSWGTDIFWSISRFSYTRNWGLVKLIVGTKFRRSHFCLLSQAGNRAPVPGVWVFQLYLWQVVAVWHLYKFRYIFKITVKWLSEIFFVMHYWFLHKMVNSNTTLSMNTKRERENRPIS